MTVPDYPEPDVTILEDLAPLSALHKASEIAIDYETTGLKPHAKGHRIVYAGIAANDSEVYAFMMPKTKAERKPFMDLLIDEKLGKLAHNCKYEHSWTLVRYGVEVLNWQWDSMLAAHQLDNRTGITNLKFQTYMTFGKIIKDEDVSKFIYEKDGSGNGFNKIFELIETSEGVAKLLRHVALDAYYEYKLAQIQMDKLNYSFLPF